MEKITEDMLTEEFLRKLVKEHKWTKEEKRRQMVSFVMSGLGKRYPRDEVAREKLRQELYDKLT